MRKNIIKLGATVDSAIGYCKKHHITLTVHQMKAKECIEKGCRAFVKYQQKPYWVSRDAEEKKQRELREEAKRLKKERLEKEKKDRPTQQEQNKERPYRPVKIKTEDDAIMKYSIADLLKARGLYFEETAPEYQENSGTNSYK